MKNRMSNKKRETALCSESFLKKFHEALASSLVYGGSATSPELRGNTANLQNNIFTAKKEA